jgi:hypothetical protein
MILLALHFASDSRNHDGMSTVRLIKHEAVPKCGSFEVRFSDGTPSRYFYFDDIAGRRLRPELVDSKQALEEAKAFARAALDHR